MLFFTLFRFLLFECGGPTCGEGKKIEKGKKKREENVGEENIRR
jgi:hypothetical protein